MTSKIDVLIDQFLEAWSRGDPAGMAACWCDDGDVVSTEGLRAQGAEIAPLLAREHAGPLRGTKASMQIEFLRPLADGLVLVDASMTISGFTPSEGGEPRTLPMHVVIVAARRDETWRFLAVRPYVPFRK